MKPLRVVGGLLIVGALLGGGQGIETVQLRHLYTFGSKDGIHPPRISNKKAAIAATGLSEHPFGLGFPVAVTTDLQGRAWITDSGTASVHIFDRGEVARIAYREIRKVGGVALQQPAGIASDRAGRVYMVDTALAAVFVFDEKGEFDRPLMKPELKPELRLLTGPTAIALSEDGRTIYVADPPKNVIVAFNREGEVNGTIQLTAATREPSAIWVLNNQLHVLGSIEHRVEIFSPAGERRGEISWEGNHYPTAFAYDTTNRRFLVANPRLAVVEIFNAEGHAVGAFGQLGDGVDQQRRVESLYIDPRGLIYVVDSHDGKVLVFREGK